MYTLQILYDDFMFISTGSWDIYPAIAYRRTNDGVIVHNCSTDFRAAQILRAEGSPVIHPIRIIEDKGRGSEIHNLDDQGKLMQYWAWAQMPLDVGVIFPSKDGRTYEFWLEMTLQPLAEDDGSSSFYCRVIKNMWMANLQKNSPYVAYAFDRGHLEDNFSYKVRYLFNKVRVWFVPNGSLEAGFSRSLAEEPCPKDKWISPSGLMAYSIPPIPDHDIGNLPTLLFGPGAHKQDRYDDPEVQGGKIALIAVKQARVQKPPNFLDRMQSTFLKQVAYNQRIMKAEEEISGINCDVADFVSQMSLDPAEEVIIYVNCSQEMKKGEKAMAGQLWVQGDRMMTASNPPFDGMANTREAAVLTAAAEAIAWKNEAIEPSGPRKGQRVVIYPKDLGHLEEVLISADPNLDPVDGHPEAYQRVLLAAAEFEVPPIFLKEDCQTIISDPVKAETVPKMMCLAERIATGSRPRVLEDGPDTIHSDDDAKEDVEADQELGMYAPGVDPKMGPTMISSAEAARQRAISRAVKSQMGSEATTTDSDFGNSIVSSQVQSPQPTRQPTPLNSDNEDEDEMTEDQRRKLKGAKKMAKLAQPPRCPSAPGARAAPKEPKGDGTPVSRMRDDTGPSHKVSQQVDPAQAAPPRAQGAKAPPLTKGQQVPTQGK
jgi:hypothetical protein